MLIWEHLASLIFIIYNCTLLQVREETNHGCHAIAVKTLLGRLDVKSAHTRIHLATQRLQIVH
ncbi:hypothetical protein GQ42DRAFT_164454 [Ramicandelaber brevisporus]|nr:hypothetical protein GQ42DRAFT_164454 [Ramicandelaber brevisporus]